jgi:uncharacterized repeat protein (TIGR01451 family)
MLGLLLMLGTGSAGAAPLAGTSIGNQASATYLDNGGTSRTTVSNSVSTIVSQVSNATLTSSQTKTGAPGQPISFPHTITNNGNGPETFNLTTANLVVGALSTAPLFYADANCDGVADNTTAITSVGPVPPSGGVACFVAQGTLNSSGANSTFDVRAQSTISPLLSNTDTAVISNNAVITVSKSVDISTGPAGTTVVYTLTYRNTGTVTANNVVIADLLQSGVSVGTTTATLIPRLNGTALAGALGTVQGSTPNRINVAVNTISTTQRVVAVLESVPANTQGTFSFTATQSGAGPVNNNNAQFCYNDGTAYVATAIAANCQAIANGSGVSSGTVSGSYNSSGGVLESNAPAVTGNTTNTSNTVPFTITVTSATGALVFNDGTTNNATPGGDGTAGNAGNAVDGSNPANQAAGVALSNTTAGQREDVNLVASAAQGSSVVFSNWVWNTGTASDTFNISVLTGNNFPAGTSFQFMRSDGITPLTDSNSDGVLDTGPIPGTGGVACPTGSPNATSSATTPCGYRVVVRAILPSTASGGPFNVVVQAASSLSPATVNTVVDRLGAITASTVDLKTPITTTNNYTGGGSTWAANCAFQDLTPNMGTCSTYVSGGGNGYQATGEAAHVVAISTNPASTIRYKLDVVNTGSIADSYDLAYNVGSGAYTVGSSTFTTPASLPAGYQLRFFLDGGAGNCSTIGAQISNTGVVPTGSAPANIRTVCAQVDVPAGVSSATYELYFRIQSPTTATATTNSSADVLHTRLFVNTVRSVTITPNNSGQIFPGGSISYCHTVTNAGNIDETAVTIGNANSLSSPWPAAATLYRDTNNNCTLDAGETTPLATNPANLATLPMNAGTSQNYIVVVQAPAAATAGQTNVTTVTVTPSGVLGGVAAPAASAATDSTVVVIGQVTLVKSQVADPSSTCATAMTTGGIGALTYSQGQISAAAPGTCIVYRVVATNIGTQNVTLVQVFDTTPPNTTCYGTPFALVNNVTANTVTVSPAAACTPATTATASLQTTAVTLLPNETVTLYMRVRINP